MGANCQCERQPGGKVVIMAEATPFGIGQACNNVSVAEKDSKGMLNHRLLVSSRDNDTDGIRKAVNEGAYLETRRPFVMRPQPPSSGSSQGGGKKKKPPREGLTPLMYAVRNGSVPGTRLLLEAKAMVNARDEDGIRPLHFAAQAGELEVAQLLVKFGAEKEAVDDDGRKAIHHIPREHITTKPERDKWEECLGGSLGDFGAAGGPGDGAASAPAAAVLLVADASASAGLPSAHCELSWPSCPSEAAGAFAVAPASPANATEKASGVPSRASGPSVPVHIDPVEPLLDTSEPLLGGMGGL